MGAAITLEQEAVDVLCQFSHVLQLESGCELYVWLTQRQFDILSQEVVEPIIAEWLASLLKEDTCGKGPEKASVERIDRLQVTSKEEGNPVSRAAIEDHLSELACI